MLRPEGRARLVAAAPTHVRGVRAHFVDQLDRAQLETLAAALSAVPGEEAGDRTGGCAS